MSDAYLQRLYDQRKAAETRFNEILDGAAAENRDLTPEEDTNLKAAQADMKSIKDHVDDILKTRELAKQAEESRAALAPILERPAEPSTPEQRTEDQMLADIFRPEWKRDGQNSMESVRSASTLDIGWEQRAALQTSGGSAVPTTFADWVAVTLVTQDPLYALATKMYTRTGQPIVLPQNTAHPAISVTAEANAIATANPTFDKITLYAFKFPVLSDYTFELERDNVINLDQYLGQSIGISMGTAVGNKLAVGTGTLEPTGILVTASAGSTAVLGAGTATTGFFDWADLIKLKNSVAAPYRNSRSAGWMVSNDALTRMQQMRDDRGQPIYLLSATPGVADTFFGRAIHENPAFSAAGSAVGSAVAYGDFSQYVVREVLPLRVERSTEWQFGADIITKKTVMTLDGHLSIAGAVKRLVCANT